MPANPRPRLPRRDQSASALIVTLGVLALLSLIAFTFASLANLERRISRNYVDLARARLLAQSGVDYARYRIQDAASREDWGLYGGEDWNGDGADSGDDSEGNADGTLDVENCPLRFARRPSFYVHAGYPAAPAAAPAPLPAPLLVTVDEGKGPKQRGYSGRLPGTYGSSEGDHYVLRVRDATGQIFVNDRNPNIATMINYVALELGLAADCGTRIINRRQARFPVPATSGFPMKDYLYNAAAPLTSDPLTKVEFDALEGFLTAHAWVDTSTVKPKPQGAGLPVVASFADSTPGLRPRKAGGTTVAPIAWDTLFTLEPRAPVNVNSASHPVLVALIRGLSARIPDIFPNSVQYPADNVTPTASPGWMEGYRLVGTPSMAAITQTKARTVADKILNYRNGTLSITYRGAAKTGPFGTWEEFSEFVDQKLIGSPLTLEESMILKANANPNTLANKFNPDSTLRQRDPSDPNIYRPRCDKTDLVYYSNEFCFGSRGYYEIASLGRVLGPSPANRLVAQAEIRTVVQTFEVMRHTTQKDFMSASVGAVTQRVAYYPEHPTDRGWPCLSTSGDQGDPADSELDGQIGVASTYYAIDSISSTYWYMPMFKFGVNRQIRTDSSSGTLYPINTDDPAQPSYLVREDVSPTGPIPGTDTANNAGCFRTYPNQTDLVQDGLIISSDRYRHLVMSSLQHKFLQDGAIALWIKPKANVTSSNLKGYWWGQDVYQGPINFKVCRFTDGGPGYVTTPTWLETRTVPPVFAGLDPQAWGYNYYVRIMTRSYLGSLQDKIWYRTFFTPCYIGTMTTGWNNSSVPSSLTYPTATWIWADPPKVTNPAGTPRWYGGQWYKMIMTWNTASGSFDLKDLNGTTDTTFSFMDTNLYLDGQLPYNYQKNWHFNELNGSTVYLGGYWVINYPPPPPPNTDVHNLQVNADPEFGNKMTPGSNFQAFDMSAVQAHGWNGNNYDPFCEGTIDEVSMYDVGLTSSQITFPDDRYLPSGYSPRYLGEFGRQDPNNSTSVLWDDDPTRTLPATGGATIRTVAYTEYRPYQNWNGNILAENQRPNWNLSFSKATGSYNAAPATWDGREQPLYTLIGVSSPTDPKCVLSGSEDFFYRLDAQDGGLTPLRVTPFFDDITVTYTVPGGVRYLEWYYAAD